jgi:hypothetical protein
MTVEQLQARLRALHAAIDDEGCLSLTLDQDPGAPCYVSHWSRPARYQPERWQQIGVGTLDDCLTALEGYADGHRRRGSGGRRAAAAEDHAPAEPELMAAE